MNKDEVIEVVQRMVARLLATNPAGVGLCLIGGARLRLLDHSARRSMDIDYHWEGDLAKKQVEVASLLRTRLLPMVKSKLGLDGDVRDGAESPFVSTVELAFYRVGSDLPRIEIPVDITHIPCLDRPVARTMDGVVFLSASDTDLLESKLLAIVLRDVVAARDWVDIYLFRTLLSPEAPARLARKLAMIKVARTVVSARLGKIRLGRVVQLRQVAQVLREQVDAAVAENLEQAGGAAMVFEEAFAITCRAFGREGGV